MGEKGRVSMLLGVVSLRIGFLEYSYSFGANENWAPVCGLFGNDMTPWRQAGCTAAHTRTLPVLMSLTSSVHAGRPSDGDGPAYACECRESVNQSPRWPVPRRGLHTLLSLFTNTRTHTHARLIALPLCEPSAGGRRRDRGPNRSVSLCLCLQGNRGFLSKRPDV